MVLWQSFQNAALGAVCKVAPQGRTCRNHLMALYPHCFRSDKGYFSLLLDAPKKLWNNMFAGYSSNLQDLDESHCPICHDEHNQAAMLHTTFKIIFTLATSCGIVYAAMKIAAQRRAAAAMREEMVE